MINGASNNLSAGVGRAGSFGGATGPRGPGGAQGGAQGASFADVLKSSIEEVSRLQQDASRAVEDLVANRREDVSGVMTAVEKSDLAFKTLLAIRTKLMDAYEELKSLQV